MMKPIRLVVVDDQTLVREGLVSLLNQMPSLEVVGSAASGSDALDVVADARPDVVRLAIMKPEFYRKI